MCVCAPDHYPPLRRIPDERKGVKVNVLVTKANKDGAIHSEAQFKEFK
jgi:hypothetical protein